MAKLSLEVGWILSFLKILTLLVSVGQQCIGGETIIAQETKNSKPKIKEIIKRFNYFYERIFIYKIYS